MFKKKFKITANKVLYMYIVALTLLSMISNIKSEVFISDAIEQASTIQIIIGIPIYFIACFFLVCLENIFIILFFLAIKFGIKKHRKDKLTDIDFGKYKDYYRDILKGYSPAVLSYIDNFELNSENDYVATLLSLKIKKFITIENDQINVIDKNTEKLSKNEKYILDIKPNNFNKFSFESLVINDALDSNLIEKKDDIKSKIIKKIIILIITYFFLQIIVSFLPREFIVENNIFIGIFLTIGYGILIFSGVLYPYFAIIYLLTYIIKSKLNKYVRTKKGNEVNKMLEGLKNYLKDFSIIEERKLEELNLWEDYLIYSVLFNQNNELVKELSVFGSN